MTPTTCFGLQWPSSGKWVTKEKVVTPNYITGMQICNSDVIRLTTFSFRNCFPENGRGMPKHVEGV